MGYIKKGSVASLAMGGISGILAAIGAYVSCQLIVLTGAQMVTKNPRNVRLSLSECARSLGGRWAAYLAY